MSTIITNLNSNNSLKHNTNISLNHRPMVGRLQTHRSLNIFHRNIFKNSLLSQIQNKSLKLSHTLMLQFKEIVKWSLFFEAIILIWPVVKNNLFTSSSFNYEMRCWTKFWSQKTLNCIIKTCKIFKNVLISFNRHLRNKLCSKNTC